MIEGQCRETLGDRRPALHHDDLRRGEILAHRLAEAGRKPWCPLTRLDHDQVARRQCTDDGRKAQQQRKIPRRDDANDAERLRQQSVRSRPKMQIGPNAAPGHPARDVPVSVLDGGFDDDRLGETCLVRRAVAEILRDRRLEVPAMAFEQRAQPFEPVATNRERNIDIAAGCRPKRMEQRFHALDGVGFDADRPVHCSVRSVIVRPFSVLHAHPYAMI